MRAAAARPQAPPPRCDAVESVGVGGQKDAGPSPADRPPGARGLLGSVDTRSVRRANRSGCSRSPRPFGAATDYASIGDADCVRNEGVGTRLDRVPLRARSTRKQLSLWERTSHADSDRAGERRITSESLYIATGRLQASGLRSRTLRQHLAHWLTSFRTTNRTMNAGADTCGTDPSARHVGLKCALVAPLCVKWRWGAAF